MTDTASPNRYLRLGDLRAAAICENIDVCPVCTGRVDNEGIPGLERENFRLDNEGIPAFRTVFAKISPRFVSQRSGVLWKCEKCVPSPEDPPSGLLSIVAASSNLSTNVNQ